MGGMGATVYGSDQRLGLGNCKRPHSPSKVGNMIYTGFSRAEIPT